MVKRIFITLGIIIGIILIPALIFFGFLVFISWNSEDSETLFTQKIEGSDLLIVDYNVWYGRDGSTTGKTLLKTTKDFDFRKIEEIPFSYIENITNKSINGVAFLSPDTREIKDKLKNKLITIGNINITTTFYKKYSFSGPCMLNEYKFHSFRETKDSLFFFGLTKVFGNVQVDSSKIGFKKGNIKILSDSIGKLYRLEIEEMILVEKGNQITNISDFSNDVNLAKACYRTYYMEPDSIVFENEFSDYGIFKEIK
jgi:hypothetical protein